MLPLLYILGTAASVRAKILIAGAAIASFLLADSWTIVTLLLQLTVCLFVLFYLKAS